MRCTDQHEVKALAIEHARAHTVSKPWGIVDLLPWSNARHNGSAIGEIRYERPSREAPDTALLLKLLFTSQPLSIQVHPDDAFARSIGLQNGKTEAWYVLSATPQAKVGLGLNRRLTPQQLRMAANDGSIADLVVWHAVSQGDSIPRGVHGRRPRSGPSAASGSACRNQRTTIAGGAGATRFHRSNRTPNHPTHGDHVNE